MRNFLKQMNEGLDTKGRYFVVLCLFFTFITSVFTILQPLLLTKIVDAFASQTNFWFFLSLAVAAHFVARLVSEARWFVIGYPEKRLMVHMRLKYINQILLKQPYFLKINPMGELINKLAQIDGAIFTISRNMFFAIIPLIMNIIILLCIVYIYFPPTYLWTLIVSFILYLAVLFKGSNYLDDKLKVIVRLNSKSASVLSDLLFNRALLRFYNCEQYELAKYAKAFEMSMLEYLKNMHRRGYFGVIQALIIMAAIVSIITISAYDISRHALTIGNFILINTYVLQLLSPLESLSKLYRDIKGSLVGINVLDDTTKSFVNMKFGDKYLDISNGVEVEFKNVSFKYPDTKELVLDNVSFKIPAYSFVGIVGKSGAGKSTIAMLLTRLHEVTEGQILFNNVPIKELSRESLHQCFANISQVTQIITDTINNNLTMGQEGTALRQTICKELNIDSFVNLLPEQYDTNISLHDKRLSEGQLQRIALARGLIADKPLLILDEVTSSLDNITERDLLNTLKALIGTRTIIFITHKLATMALSDTILVFDKGKLVESGAHKELLKKRGHYYQLWHGMGQDSMHSVSMAIAKKHKTNH